jgi:hypothetical protein
MKDQDGKFDKIIGNIFNNKSAPAFTNINGDEIGSCFAIQQYSKIPTKFCPKIALKANIVRDTEWESTEHDITLCVVPILDPIPFGKNIESISFDDLFIKEMSSISIEHGFWAKLMSNVIEQAERDSEVKTILKRLVKSTDKQNRDPVAQPQKGLGPTPSPSWPLSSILPSLAKNPSQASNAQRIFCPEPHSRLRQRNF